jgi:hypothetical protein
MFGTNDSKSFNWNQAEFVNNYLEMCKTFLKQEQKPELYLMVPPPLYIAEVFEMNSQVINKDLPKLIPEIKYKLNSDKVHIIDMFEHMGGIKLDRMGLFIDDGCHPNNQGQKHMSDHIYQVLTGKPFVAQEVEEQKSSLVANESEETKSQMISIDVEGVFFTIDHALLTKFEDSAIAAMFSGRWDE